MAKQEKAGKLKMKTISSSENKIDEISKVNLNKTPEETIDEDIKVDLNKPIEPVKNEIKEDNPDNEGVVGVNENANATEEQEEIQPEEQAQEKTPVLEEITEEEIKEEIEELTDEVEEAVAEAKETGKKIPENLQKVIDFMSETGGSLEDYVNLNQDFSNYDDMTILREYYKKTKSHLTSDEIQFLIEDSFSYDEEVDEDRDIRKKKIALKEQVANAKSHLDGQKSKYYEEIKAGSKLTQEQQKAVNFFNRYNKESEENSIIAEKQTNTFLNKTEQVFNDKFKGFEYNVGEKRYRFNVNNVKEVKSNQSDINNFVKRFLNEKNEMSDAKGYHKSLYTAMNADAIANHFYEQGKVDALQNSVAKAKNVNMDPRQSHGKNENTSGPQVRVLNDDTSSNFKFKLNK